MNSFLTAQLWLVYIFVPFFAFIATFFLIVLMRPLLQKYALARPNARSSHKIPTPQGGGLAVIAATIGAIAGVNIIFGLPLDPEFLPLGIATLILVGVGALDDLRPIPVVPRLICQAIAVAIVLASLPAGLRLSHAVPFWLERITLLLAGLWVINLVNFMDGLDWITVAEIVPITAALACVGAYGGLPISTTLIALALCGAILGFAPFNRPIAKLFLGDVGSLPIGLLLGWCILQLAAGGHFAAALLFPLYYFADATITLMRRLASGEKIWQAHRTHFYQRATDNGFSALEVVLVVFALNVALSGLAAISIFQKWPYISIMTIAIGIVLVTFVLWQFSRRRNHLSKKSPT